MKTSIVLSPDRQKGFALLETMLAIVILGTVFATAIRALASFSRWNASAERLNTAARISQSVMSQLRRGVYGPGESEKDLDPDFPGFRLRASVERVPGSGERRHFAIHWNEYGVTKETGFTTYAARKDSGI